MTKTIDGIKPQPKTELEYWTRWLNHFQSRLTTAPWSDSKKIVVQYVSDDPLCEGRGSTTCLKEGEHSWFNHAMDKAY